MKIYSTHNRLFTAFEQHFLVLFITAFLPLTSLQFLPSKYIVVTFFIYRLTAQVNPLNAYHQYYLYCNFINRLFILSYVNISFNFHYDVFFLNVNKLYVSFITQCTILINNIKYYLKEKCKASRLKQNQTFINFYLFGECYE